MQTLSYRPEPTADRAVIGDDLRRVLRDFIVRRVGDEHTAEDLTQDVLVKAYRSRTELGRVDDVAAWIYRIARNTIVDYFRARDRHPGPAALRDDDAAVADADDNRAVRELAECLRPLINGLDPKYRQALTLTDLDGLTQTEAARRVGISTSGMKSRVQRARGQLRRALIACCAVHTDVGGRITDYSAPAACCAHRWPTPTNVRRPE